MEILIEHTKDYFSREDFYSIFDLWDDGANKFIASAKYYEKHNNNLF